jgi:glycogen debranching enzyme
MSDSELTEKVRNLMFDNIKAGLSPYLNAHYCYVMPSPGNYPFQWWWDTCFNIFILCALDETALAKQNIKSLLRMQEKDGFIGHMIFWESLLPRQMLNILQGPPVWNQIRPHTSSLIQPPLIAQSLLRIYEMDKDDGLLEELLPRIKKYFHWLSVNRDFDGDGLLSIISPFESGLDWKPSFAEVLGFKQAKANEKYYWATIYVELRNFLRWYHLKWIYRSNYFIVKETLFNTMYVQDLRALAKLCDMVRDKDAEKYRSMASKAANRILEIMYDEETAAFYDVYGRNNKQAKVLTFTIALPILLDEVPREIAAEILKRHFLNKEEFKLKYPIPSVAKTEPSFSPYESKFLWRGPTWIVANWFLLRSFKSHGLESEARQLYQSVRSLVEKSGFREYYNPLTGTGYGAKDFTWSGLIVDMMRLEK